MSLIRTLAAVALVPAFATVFHVEFRQTDMQFSTLHVLWRNTFSESKVEPLDVEEVEFELDEALTKEKAE